MSTLYIRDVPEKVTETLKKRAAAQGSSLSAYVAKELEKLAEMPSNAEVVARIRGQIRDDGPTSAEILAAIHEARGE
jgi:hypothetical protein